MNYNEDNIKVFVDTLNICDTEIKKQTELLIEQTEVYKDAAKQIKVSQYDKRYDNTIIDVISGGTVSTAYSYADKYHVAMLNFADALVPGGLVLYGATTQEENVCRCTNLYRSLKSDIALLEYYKVNKNSKDTAVATDALVYSPNVTIFKDDIDYKRISIKSVDVITSPAPCGYTGYNLDDIITHRIKCILSSAIKHRVEILILGAWGCGAFAQNPHTISKLFNNAIINYNGYFDKIIFAIKRTDKGDSDLLPIFKKNLIH